MERRGAHSFRGLSFCGFFSGPGGGEPSLFVLLKSANADAMITHVHFNGRLLPREEASLHLQDLALLRGYGIFDYFLFQHRKPLFIDDYLQRFFRSALFLNLTPPFQTEDLATYIHELIDANGMEEGAIRLLLTGGYSPDGYNPGTPNLAILQHPYPEHPGERYVDGIRVLTSEYKRDLPEVKTINYIHSIYLSPRLREAGALEPLYVQNGLVTEAARSNIFAVFAGKRLVTPKEGILYGITRRKVLEMGRNYYEMEERDLSLQELLRAEEVFLTGSSKQLMPVVRIDRHTIGTGRPGPVTQHLMEAFQGFKNEYLASSLVGG